MYSLTSITQSLTKKYWCDDEAFRSLHCIKCTQIVSHGGHQFNEIIKHTTNSKSFYTYFAD